MVIGILMMVCAITMVFAAYNSNKAKKYHDRDQEKSWDLCCGLLFICISLSFISIFTIGN